MRYALAVTRGVMILMANVQTPAHWTRDQLRFGIEGTGDNEGTFWDDEEVHPDEWEILRLFEIVSSTEGLENEYSLPVRTTNSFP